MLLLYNFSLMSKSDALFRIVISAGAVEVVKSSGPELKALAEHSKSLDSSQRSSRKKVDVKFSGVCSRMFEYRNPTPYFLRVFVTSPSACSSRHEYHFPLKICAYNSDHHSPGRRILSLCEANFPYFAPQDRCRFAICTSMISLPGCYAWMGRRAQSRPD